MNNWYDLLFRDLNPICKVDKEAFFSVNEKYFNFFFLNCRLDFLYLIDFNTIIYTRILIQWNNI